MHPYAPYVAPVVLLFLYLRRSRAHVADARIPVAVVESAADTRAAASELAPLLEGELGATAADGHPGAWSLTREDQLLTIKLVTPDVAVMAWREVAPGEVSDELRCRWERAEPPRRGTRTIRDHGPLDRDRSDDGPLSQALAESLHHALDGVPRQGLLVVEVEAGELQVTVAGASVAELAARIAGMVEPSRLLHLEVIAASRRLAPRAAAQVTAASAIPPVLPTTRTNGGSDLPSPFL